MSDHVLDLLPRQQRRAPIVVQPVVLRTRSPPVAELLHVDPIVLIVYPPNIFIRAQFQTGLRLSRSPSIPGSKRDRSESVRILRMLLFRTRPTASKCHHERTRQDSIDSVRLKSNVNLHGPPRGCRTTLEASCISEDVQLQHTGENCSDVATT